MQASSLTSRLKGCLTVTEWRWWQLPPLLRLYVAAPPVMAAVLIGVLGAVMDWHLVDVGKFALLACCGMMSVAFTPRLVYAIGGITKDFSTMWALPIAILLPPIYAALAPILFLAVMQLFVHRGIFYRRVFTAASISCCCVLISFLFRWFPAAIAGPSVGHGLHAFTWALAVAACEIVGGRAQHFFIVGAVKLTDPTVRVWDMELDRESLQGTFVELDLGVLITLAVGLSPALVALAMPTVFLVRRFLVHPALLAQSRVDSKTGLLNVSTWENEAEGELSRCVRTRSPMAIALVDIDHFKRVNDTYGHLVGDRVLKAIAGALTGQSRDYDHAGRFGGEEFVLLLAQTGERDACKIAERLRGYVASLAIPIDGRSDAPRLHVTISIGVTALARGDSFELADLLAAADSAMYAAKQAGRNQVAFAQPLRDMGIDNALNPAPGATRQDQPQDTLGSSPLSSHQVVLVQGEQAAASLCRQM